MRRHIVIDRTTGELTDLGEIPADIDPAEYLRQQLHDCPECRAALERGERPIIGLGKPPPFARRPRWRTLKRR